MTNNKNDIYEKYKYLECKIKNCYYCEQHDKIYICNMTGIELDAEMDICDRYMKDYD